MTDTEATSETPGAIKRKLFNDGLPREQKEIVQGYPQELQQQFQPLYCALCNAKLSSNTSAMMHYNSKNHKKKVNNYLEQWSQRTGEPMPKKLCIDKTKDKGPLHCEACDLALTSQQHAQQHYMGKAHQKVIMKKSNPTGSGYVQDGKWIRTSTTKSDPTGRFHIGSGFIKQQAAQQQPQSQDESTTNTEDDNSNKKNSPQEMLSPAVTMTNVTNTDITDLTNDNNAILLSPTPPSTREQLQPTIYDNNDSLYCSLCKIHVTSAPQMPSHLNGSKHRKKLKNSLLATGEVRTTITTSAELNTTLTDDVDTTITSTRNRTPQDTNNGTSGPISLQQQQSPTSLLSSSSSPADISMYRTPTGSFYCRPCDVALANEQQFRTHLASKRHNKRKRT